MHSYIKPLNKQSSRDRCKVWLAQAGYDLQASKLSLDNGFNEWSTYQAEQSVEKSLKAVLVHSGYKPPRIHKLQVLIGMANEANDEFRRTSFQFRHLESFTFISRYPFLIPNKNQTPHELISKYDATKAFGQAKSFVTKVSNILKHNVITPLEVDHITAEAYKEPHVKERIIEVTNKLKQAFDPDKIILFGSFARNTNLKRPSTLDILLIAPTELPFIDRIIKARTATKGGLPVVEALVYTPQEFALMSKGPEEAFFNNALEEGKILYEKNS